jgi:hypothetical protein
MLIHSYDSLVRRKNRLWTVYFLPQRTHLNSQQFFKDDSFNCQPKKSQRRPTIFTPHRHLNKVNDWTCGYLYSTFDCAGSG